VNINTEMKPQPKQPLLPPQNTALRLGAAGFVVGPLVDSLHNKCLLRYDIAPITLSSPLSTSDPLLSSSWVVPPLLAFAYIVLGYILPRVIDFLPIPRERLDEGDTDYDNNEGCDTMRNAPNELRNKAFLAVSSTAAIIKLSEILETHETFQIGASVFNMDAGAKLQVMALADLCQWMTLDRTSVALIAATVTAFGGPLSELPFVSGGFWEYIPTAADYTPLAMIQPGGTMEGLLSSLLGDHYRDLTLSSITGPCYFAVTLDAIALGRYFYSMEAREYL
jgi:hypothetical protein